MNTVAETHNIITLNKSHIKDAGAMLGCSFQSDPLAQYILPDNTKRKKNLQYVFSTNCCFGLKKGEVHALSENLEGVAVWIPFDKFKIHLFRQFICALKTKLYKIGVGAAKRFVPIGEIYQKTHLKFAPGKHWYLETLGVDPTHQGKGVGSQLISHMLNKIDENPLPVYLETNKEINVKFYRKFGFEVMEKITIPNSDVPQWFLLRPPQ